MIKLTFCLVRLPHLTRAQFQSYWRETHGPLVRDHAAVLRVRRYVQTHSFDEATQAPLRGSRGAPESYDGVAEAWFDSMEDLGRNTPEVRVARQALLDDERRFIDLARSPLFLGTSTTFVGD